MAADWSRLDSVPWAENYTFGKPRKEGDYPMVFLFGQIGGEKPTAHHRGLSALSLGGYGQDWVQINDRTMQFGTIAAGLAGDMQTFGRVYIATTARGIFYGEPSPE